MSTIKRGNIWWFEFEFRGARIRESSNSKVRAVCERLERERRRGLELGTGGLRKISGPLSASRAVDAYRSSAHPIGRSAREGSMSLAGNIWSLRSASCCCPTYSLRTYRSTSVSVRKKGPAVAPSTSKLA